MEVKDAIRKCRAWQNNSDAIPDYEILEVLVSAAEAQQWQPIETAPRDESRILVYINDPASSVQRHAFGHVYESGRVIAEGYNGDWRITHWMPLPEPHHVN